MLRLMIRPDETVNDWLMGRHFKGSGIEAYVSRSLASSSIVMGYEGGDVEEEEEWVCTRTLRNMFITPALAIVYNTGV